jgi:uncharacterized phiE125 gp8 family phage protein
METYLAAPPTSEPVTAEEVRLMLNLASPDDEVLLSTLITAARQLVEEPLGRSLMPTVWDAHLDGWHDSFAEAHKSATAIALPKSRLRSVEWVKYTDYLGTEYTFPANQYIVDTKSEPGRIVLAYGCSWPSVALSPAKPITIRFTAGYADADDVPAILRESTIILAVDMYEHRSVSETAIAMRGAMEPSDALLNAVYRVTANYRVR